MNRAQRRDKKFKRDVGGPTMEDLAAFREYITATDALMDRKPRALACTTSSRRPTPG